MKVILTDAFLNWIYVHRNEEYYKIQNPLPTEEYEMEPKEWADLFIETNGKAVPFLTTTKDLQHVNYFLEKIDLYSLSFYLI